MRLEERPDGGLVAVQDDARLAGWLAAGGVASLGLAAWRLVRPPPTTESLQGALGAAVVLLLIAAVVFERSAFVFDRTRRVVAWRRSRLLGARGGTVPFDAVVAVVVESLADLEANPSVRLTLRTREGTIPFTKGYRPDPGGDLVEVAGRLNRLLGRDGEEPVADSVEALVAAGRTIDAVRLLRTTRGLTLLEAKDEVERLRGR